MKEKYCFENNFVFYNISNKVLKKVHKLSHAYTLFICITLFLTQGDTYKAFFSENINYNL